MSKLGFLSLLLLASTTAYGSDDIVALRQQVAELARQVENLQEKLASLSASESADHVDLAVRDSESIATPDTDHVLSKPWWQNFHISGFAAAGIYGTGAAGTRREPGFEIKETTLFIEGSFWDNANFFLELQTNRLGKDKDVYTRTGEVYMHFRDISLTDKLSVGLKLGRIDIPFGEEYLQQDAFENPLIMTSAAYPYGFDEGLLVHGNFGRLNWIVAVTDGTDDRSIEDDAEKAWNLKLSGKPSATSYLSLSLMKNGNSGESALEFGGSHIEPVGSSHVSTLGNSPSGTVDSLLAEADAKFAFQMPGTAHGYLALSFGAARISDSDARFDRDLRWFSIEQLLTMNQRWYVAARFSEIGTYDGAAGYHFDGKTFAGGNTAFGYDVRRMRRAGIGLGWTPHAHLRAKFELARDWYQLIDISARPTNNTERWFSGLEVAARF